MFCIALAFHIRLNWGMVSVEIPRKIMSKETCHETSKYF